MSYELYFVRFDIIFKRAFHPIFNRNLFILVFTCVRSEMKIGLDAKSLSDRINDYLSSAWNFRSIEYHHALYLDFETLAGLWPWAIPSLKIEILGFFHHHHEIYDPLSIIMSYIENLGLWPDWGVGHRRRWPWVQYKKHFWCWDLSKELSHVQFW
jgi:hypothetical protein